jgi:hypothetical protein
MSKKTKKIQKVNYSKILKVGDTVKLRFGAIGKITKIEKGNNPIGDILKGIVQHADGIEYQESWYPNGESFHKLGSEIIGIV